MNEGFSNKIKKILYGRLKVMREKGQMNVQTLLEIPIMFLMFWVFLQMFSAFTTTNGLLYTVLDNTTMVPQYGAIIKMMMMLVPLLVGVLIIVSIWQQASQPRYPQY
jgi:ABC-type Na+ efflux pump permease subunit